MSDKKITDPPSETKSDAVYTMVKAGIASIPLVGGAAAEFFSALITPPINRRRNAWMNSIAEDLKELEKKVDQFKIEKLSENETFVSTFISAAQKASKTHVNAKLEALRNAVLNSALNDKSDEDFLESLFLDMIEEMSTLHIRLLRFLDRYPNMVIYKMEKLKKYDYDYSYDKIREFEKEYESEVKYLFSTENKFIGKLIPNLIINRGLIEIDDDYSYDWKDLPGHASLTDLGKHFLHFITSPLQVSSGPALDISEADILIREYDGRKSFQQFSALIEKWRNTSGISYRSKYDDYERFMYRSAIPVYLYIKKYLSKDVGLEIYDNSIGWGDDKLVATICDKDGRFFQTILLFYVRENQNMEEAIIYIMKEMEKYLERADIGPQQVALILLPCDEVTKGKSFFDEIYTKLTRKFEPYSDSIKHIGLILPCDDLEGLIEMF